MATAPELGNEQPDPAAIFACALSLREACLKSAKANPQVDLSESYNGMDEFLREMMRIGNLFEAWACEHVAFNELNDVWPYLLEDKFGDACLGFMLPGAMAEFNGTDCLRVALRLRLPIKAGEKLRVPIDVQAPNPNTGSGFAAFRIRSVRDDLESGKTFSFTADDEPFDEEFGPLYFSVYGVGADGLSEHIADRVNYAEALKLADKLAPGVALPSEPIAFATAHC